MLNLWLPDFRPDADARCRVFCFPHGGGSAALYRHFRALSADWIDFLPVELPGRSAHFSEPPFSRMEPLIAALKEALCPALDRPFAFFGHSMGASIALAAGLRLRSPEGRMASHVFVSGRSPPGSKRSHLHRASDSALIAALTALGLTPASVLARQDMIQALLPMIRADLALGETYAPLAGERLSCPLTVFTGQSDPVAPARNMDGWSAFTSAGCSTRHYPGGHFFLFAVGPDLMRAVSDAMRGSANRQ